MLDQLINELLLPAELNRLTFDSAPFAMQREYVNWLVHFRNNQLSTLTQKKFGGLLNAVFDAIEEYNSVIREIISDPLNQQDTPQLWVQLAVRSHQIGLTAFHLAMGGVLQEAGSLMRLSIETLAYALKIEAEPYAGGILLYKDDNDIKKLFNNKFRHKHAEELYQKIPGLYEQYRYWCDNAAHPTRLSLEAHLDGNDVCAQTDSFQKNHEFLLRLVVSYVTLASTARTTIKEAKHPSEEQKSRILRIQFYEKEWAELAWASGA